jgi:hypothetical protein
MQINYVLCLQKIHFYTGAKRFAVRNTNDKMSDPEEKIFLQRGSECEFEGNLNLFF